MIVTTLSPELSSYLHDNLFNLDVSGLTSTGVIRWGDSNVQEISQDGAYTHKYDEYGEFTISVESCEELSSYGITIIPIYNQQIEIVSYTSSITAGCPAEISFSAFSFDETNTFTFYSSGSNSGLYVDPPTFWSHLDPSWRFEDIDGNVVDYLTLKGEPVTIDDVVVGYETFATIFYIDELTGTPNIIITKESK